MTQHAGGREDGSTKENCLANRFDSSPRMAGQRHLRSGQGEEQCQQASAEPFHRRRWCDGLLYALIDIGCRWCHDIRHVAVFVAVVVTAGSKERI